MREKEANRLKLLDKTIFTYTTTHLSPTDKVRFYYALKGRNGKNGIILELDITQLGKTVLLADANNEKSLSEFLASWGCEYSYLPVLIRADQPTQTYSNAETLINNHRKAGKRTAPKYPLKLGAGNRRTIWPTTPTVPRPHIEDETERLERRREQIDILIERQIGIAAAIDEEWMKNLPTTDVEDAGFCQMQELALIRQRRNTRQNKLDNDMEVKHTP